MELPIYEGILHVKTTRYRVSRRVKRAYVEIILHLSDKPSSYISCGKINTGVVSFIIIS